MVHNVSTLIAITFCVEGAVASVQTICSENNKMTPENPKINPVRVGILEKFSFHLRLSKMINQIAVAAESIDTIPLEIYCSDQMIAAISTNSRRKPINMA